MNPPPVSVTIPLYNKAPFIAATVRSALAQTFADFEIVVLDNGSTDGSMAQLQDIDDPRLVIVRQEHSSLAVSRTRVMREGRGRYVAFLDADDVWYPDHLSHLMELVRRYPDAVLLGNGFVEGSKLDPPVVEAASSVRYRLVEDYFAECASGRAPFFGSSCMVLRERALALGGFPVGNHCGEDLALWMRLAADAPVAVSDFVGCYYRRGVGGLSQTAGYRNATDISMQTLEEFLERRTDWSEDRRVAVNEFRNQLALAHCLDCLQAGETEQARKYLQIAGGTRSLRRRLWLARILMVLPRALQTAAFRLASFSRRLRVAKL